MEAVDDENRAKYEAFYEGEAPFGNGATGVTVRPVFVAAGTSSALEREVTDAGVGFVFDTFEALKARAEDTEFMASAAAVIPVFQQKHSFEHWVEPLVAFFGKVVEQTDVPPADSGENWVDPPVPIKWRLRRWASRIKQRLRRMR